MAFEVSVPGAARCHTVTSPVMDPRHIAVIAPCFNEGDVAVRFVQELEQVLAALQQRFTITLVDDASTDSTADLLARTRITAANVELHVIVLPYNMGHQEAIHQGLIHASGSDADHFIVMDSDGEDDPTAIPELLSITEAPIIFVGRGKRSEPPFFRIGYWFYRLLFRLVAARRISFGNYSMIDRRVLEAVLDRSFTHYAAFLSRQRVPQRIIVRDRRKRIDGNPKMGYHDLGIHALHALIEYSEELLRALLRVFIALALVFLLSIAVIVGIKLFTAWAIPGWASLLSASLFSSMLLCLGFFAIGLLLVNTSRRRERAGRRLYEVRTLKGA